MKATLHTLCVLLTTLLCGMVRASPLYSVPPEAPMESSVERQQKRALWGAHHLMQKLEKLVGQGPKRQLSLYDRKIALDVFFGIFLQQLWDLDDFGWERDHAPRLIWIRSRPDWQGTHLLKMISEVLRDQYVVRYLSKEDFEYASYDDVVASVIQFARPNSLVVIDRLALTVRSLLSENTNAASNFLDKLISESKTDLTIIMLDNAELYAKLPPSVIQSINFIADGENAVRGVCSAALTSH